jgi:hypothetical protein
MVRKLVICTALAALGISGPAWAGSPLDEYQQTGHITPCRYSSGQLQGSVPNDVAQYAPEYAAQLQAAARERASGCGSSASGGATGRGTGAGGAGGGDSGSNSATTGAGGAPAAAVAATARRARARARVRRQARARLAAATVAPTAMSSDSRVSKGTLLLAALPILLLLGLTGALRWRGALERRVGPGLHPARTSSGAIILPSPDEAASGNGTGNGHGNGEVPIAEAPTEEVAALRGEHPARNA